MVLTKIAMVTKKQQSANGDKNSDNQPAAVKNSICSD